MSSEGVNRPDEPTITVRSALPVVEAPRPAEPGDDGTPGAKSTKSGESSSSGVRPPVPFDAPDVLTSAPRRDHTVVRHVTRWSTGPVGRLFWPSALIAVMLVIAGVGAKTFLPSAAVVKHTPGPIGITSALPPTDQPAQAQPLPSFTAGTDQPSADAPLPINTVRPGDQLAAWATPLSTKLGIPAVALQAYGYAELVATHNQPACRLTWSTLAGIGKIESDHGRAQGATLQPDGTSLPSIIGPPLDGQSGRKSIPDTDGGVLDGDRSWDRAVGPMQFIPSTWKQWGIDADGNGEIDINNVYDASVAAADYLCASGRDLSTSDGWHAAISSYNAVQAYINDVFSAANDYGRRSRS